MVRPRPDIARAKRSGLDLDLDAVCAAGVEALSADDHYRLKTYGVCPQRQDDLFMVRLRVAGGRLDRPQVGAVTEAARLAGSWVHLTTRQNLELHSVRLADVPAINRILAPVGLLGRSSCGHTIRNVMACAEAATSAEEPFDVTPDAMFLSEALVARSAELNVALPSRLNISLGGCTACGLEALTNDIGLVACVQDGEPGYQLWAGGSLGSAPRLALLLRAFLPRTDLWAAVWSLIEWFCTEGDVDVVAKGRLKFLIDAKGETAFRQAFAKRFKALRCQQQPVPPPIDPPAEQLLEQALARAPARGWRSGIRPERRPGLASVTVRLPLGDMLAEELRSVIELAPTGYIVITRDQNLLVPSVPVQEVDRVVGLLADHQLGPDGARGAADVRACPGLSFCSLAITGSQAAAVAIERALAARLDLPHDLSVAVSGCPNSCTKHQAADIGLAGTKVKVDGKVGLGYQLFLGADLPAGSVGEPVVRLADHEVPAAVLATVETWMALRRPGEHPGATFRRVGLAAVAAALELRLRDVGLGDRPLPADAPAAPVAAAPAAPVAVRAPASVSVS